MYESLNDALIACVKASGGSKTVGPQLWPEKTIEAAQRTLLDALNEERPAKLSPEHVMLVFRIAKEAGFHGGLNYVLDALGYAPTTPVAPKDEFAELQRQFHESVRVQAELVGRMERLAGVAA